MPPKRKNDNNEQDTGEKKRQNVHNLIQIFEDGNKDLLLEASKFLNKYGLVFLPPGTNLYKEGDVGVNDRSPYYVSSVGFVRGRVDFSIFAIQKWIALIDLRPSSLAESAQLNYLYNTSDESRDFIRRLIAKTGEDIDGAYFAYVGNAVTSTDTITLMDNSPIKKVMVFKGDMDPEKCAPLGRDRLHMKEYKQTMIWEVPQMKRNLSFTD